MINKRFSVEEPHKKNQFVLLLFERYLWMMDFIRLLGKLFDAKDFNFVRMTKIDEVDNVLKVANYVVQSTRRNEKESRFRSFSQLMTSTFPPNSIRIHLFKSNSSKSVRVKKRQESTLPTSMIQSIIPLTNETMIPFSEKYLVSFKLKSKTINLFRVENRQNHTLISMNLC